MTRRVAILCEFSTLNGGERSLLAALPFVLAAGWSPIVLCPAHGPLADGLREIDVPVLGFETRDVRGAPRDRAELRSDLADLLKRTSPALLHANSISMGRLSGPVAQELGLTSIAHLRDILSLSRPAIADLGCHARLLAVSAATRAAHISQGLPERTTHVLHNGVDLRGFAPHAAEGWLHRELRIPDSAPLVGCIGQLILRKGQDVLTTAAASLAERCPELHYVFVGARHSEKLETRQFEAELRARFSAPPLVGRGHFVGTRVDVAKLLPELAMLVHPARQEPLGRVLLEAAACGRAIVATDVGGTREIFPPEAQAAILVSPDDPGQLAAAVDRLSLDGSLRKSLGARARRRVELAFDAATSAAGLIGHYNEVVNS